MDTIFTVVERPENFKNLSKDNPVVGLLDPHSQRVLISASEIIKLTLEDFEECDSGCGMENLRSVLNEYTDILVTTLGGHVKHMLKDKFEDLSEEQFGEVLQGLTAGIVYTIAKEYQEITVVQFDGKIGIMNSKDAMKMSLAIDLIDGIKDLDKDTGAMS